MSRDDCGLATVDDNLFADDHLPRDVSASLELEESALCLILQQPRQMGDLLGVSSGASFSQESSDEGMADEHGVEDGLG